MWLGEGATLGAEQACTFMGMVLLQRFVLGKSVAEE